MIESGACSPTPGSAGRPAGVAVVRVCAGVPISCSFEFNMFRRERGPRRKQPKLICVACILPVNGAVSICK